MSAGLPLICVGLGRRGRQWIQWARMAGADVLGVVDKSDTLQQEVGDLLGFPAHRRFGSIEEAVKSLRPQAAIVCTPNETHYALAKECLRQNLHLLIEKPLAQTPEEAYKLVATAEQRGLQLAVAQQYRYRGAFPAMQAALNQGRLGTLTGGLVQFYRWRPTVGMRLPILLNQAIHHFDVLRALLGRDPLTCRAEVWDPPWNGCDGPTCVEATFRFDGEIIVHYSGSYVAKGHDTSFDGIWRLEGNLGQLMLNSNGLAVLRPDSDEEETLYTPRPSSTRPESKLCRDFLEAVETGKPAPTSGKDNLVTLAMAFAALKSAQDRQETSVASILSHAESVDQ